MNVRENRNGESPIVLEDMTSKMEEKERKENNIKGIKCCLLNINEEKQQSLSSYPHEGTRSL